MLRIEKDDSTSSPITKPRRESHRNKNRAFREGKMCMDDIKTNLKQFRKFSKILTKKLFQKYLQKNS